MRTYLLPNVPRIETKPDGFSQVVVCAACLPGKKVWRKFPATYGLAVSHGMCLHHFFEFVRELRQTPKGNL